MYVDDVKIQACLDAVKICVRLHGVNDSYHHGDLRRALIDAAVAAIAEGGPAALSLRAVAKRAGVSHAAPAHHFGDKAGLLTAVAAEGFDRLADTLEAAWSDTGDFVAVGAAYVRFAVDSRAHFAVMFRHELLHGDDPDLRRSSDRAAAALHRGSGTAEGPGWNPAALAAWSLAHGFAELLSGGNFPPEVKDDPEAAFKEVGRATGLRVDQSTARERAAH